MPNLLESGFHIEFSVGLLSLLKIIEMRLEKMFYNQYLIKELVIINLS